MNRKVLTAASFCLSAFLIVYVVFQLVSFSGTDYVTQTVYSQTVDEQINMDGFIVREETVIPLTASGYLSANYSVGTKVSLGADLGKVYPNRDAAGNRYTIRQLQLKANALSDAKAAADTTDVIKPEDLNQSIRQSVFRLIASRDSGDFSGVEQYKEEIIRYAGQREMVLYPETDYSAQIEELNQQIQTLEALGENSLTSVISTASGYFVDHIDGYEETLSSIDLSSLTISKAKEMISAYTSYQADTSAVKIVTSHKWRYITVLSGSDAEQLRSGSSVSLRFSHVSSDVTMTVEKLTRNEETGEYLAVFLGENINEELLSIRFCSATIVVASYTGLKIPKEALRFEEGVRGVYVVVMDKMYFRKIEEIYEAEDYFIAKINEDDADSLRLYDTIIVQGKNLYDQKPL